MKSRTKPQESGSEELFRSKLRNIIKLRHELVRSGDLNNWARLEEHFAPRNTTPLPAKSYANEGLAQVIFFESDEQCDISYKDKKGKYQSQQGIMLPKI